MIFFSVFLQNLILKIIKHNSDDTRSNNGNVFLFVRTSDEDEHASRVQNNNNTSVRRSTIQFLSQMV